MSTRQQLGVLLRITLVVDVSTFEYAELWRNRDGSTSTNNSSGASTLVFSADWKLN